MLLEVGSCEGRDWGPLLSGTMTRQVCGPVMRQFHAVRFFPPSLECVCWDDAVMVRRPGVLVMVSGENQYWLAGGWARGKRLPSLKSLQSIFGSAGNCWELLGN